MPVSNFLSPEIPLEVKQKIARMGMETMLKMVRYDWSMPLLFHNVHRSDYNHPWFVPIDTSAFQVFVDNFVHGDLHPGNILVHCWGPLSGSSDGAGASGEAPGKTTLTDLWDTVVVSFRPDRCPLQLVLLDAGIVTQLSDYDLANLRAVFTAVVLHQVRDRILNLVHSKDLQKNI